MSSKSSGSKTSNNGLVSIGGEGHRIIASSGLMIASKSPKRICLQ